MENIAQKAKIEPREITPQSTLEKEDKFEVEPSIEISERLVSDTEWVSKNREKLARYEGNWIAVYKKNVVAYGADARKVEREAIVEIGHDVPDLYMRFLEDGLCQQSSIQMIRD